MSLAGSQQPAITLRYDSISVSILSRNLTMTNKSRIVSCLNMSRVCVMLLWIVALVGYMSLILFISGKATDSLKSASWLCTTINEITHLDVLRGAQERLIWPALWSVVVLLYVVITLYVVRMTTQAPSHYIVLIVFIFIIIVLEWRAWAQMTHFDIIRNSASCPVIANYGGPFVIAPYLSMIFRTLYGPEFADFYLKMFKIMVSINWVTIIIMLSAGQFFLWPACNVPMLASHMVAWRSLLFLSSSVFTLSIFYFINESQWLAEITKHQMPEESRSLQTGYVLYVGITSSFLIGLFFYPLGLFLMKRARELARLAIGEASTEDLENWEKRHGLVLLTQGRLLQIGSVLAPVVTSVAASLIKSVFPTSS